MGVDCSEGLVFEGGSPFTNSCPWLYCVSEKMTRNQELHTTAPRASLYSGSSFKRVQISCGRSNALAARRSTWCSIVTFVLSLGNVQTKKRSPRNSSTATRRSSLMCFDCGFKSILLRPEYMSVVTPGQDELSAMSDSIPMPSSSTSETSDGKVLWRDDER